MRRWMSILAISLTSSSVSAQDLTSVFIDLEICAVREFGYKLKKDALEFAGEMKYSATAEYQECFVRVPRSVFDRNFKFCFLSGVNRESDCRIGFGGSDVGRDVVFAQYFRQHKPAPNGCGFTCVGR